MRDDKSRRCIHCDWNWPTGESYATCPMCLGETTTNKDLAPDPEAFAKAGKWKLWHAYEERERNLAALEITRLDEQFDPIDALEDEFKALDDA